MITELNYCYRIVLLSPRSPLSTDDVGPREHKDAAPPRYVIPLYHEAGMGNDKSMENSVHIQGNIKCVMSPGRVWRPKCGQSNQEGFNRQLRGH